MLHAKAVDRGRQVVADLLLLGIESNTLSDYGLVWLAGGAPYCKRHLESDDQRAGRMEVARAGAERVLSRKFVRGRDPFLVRRDITIVASADYMLIIEFATNRPISVEVSSCFPAQGGAGTY